jgi:hypothetical protein
MDKFVVENFFDVVAEDYLKRILLNIIENLESALKAWEFSLSDISDAGRNEDDGSYYVAVGDTQFML